MLHHIGLKMKLLSSPDLSMSLLFMKNVYPNFLFIYFFYFINIQWCVLNFNILIEIIKYKKN